MLLGVGVTVAAPTPDEARVPVVKDPETREFYRAVLERLVADDVPHLLGGAYALAFYTGIRRETKDLDVFLRETDVPAAEAALAPLGCRVEPFSSHWLWKARQGEDFVDLIFSSGNGIADVDEAWFEHAEEGEVFGVPARFVPPEETIWSRAFIMERERFDGADVAHLLHDHGHRLDWDRLLALFGEHWRVLLAHLVLFGFVYPTRRDLVPRAVMADLCQRAASQEPEPYAAAICRGTLLSRSQYLHDIEERGYLDGRLNPDPGLSPSEVEAWTARIAEDGQR